MSKKYQPMQPVVIDDRGVGRFKSNAVVLYLLDKGPFDMNHLAVQGFSEEDQAQFAQLIGYSIGGWCDLSYVSRKQADKARKILDENIRKRGKHK